MDTRTNTFEYTGQYSLEREDICSRVSYFTRRSTATSNLDGGTVPYKIHQARGSWAYKMDFLLSAMGYVIGFGNVWRFPYLVYSNGGGTFLVPYFFMLVFVGIPLFYMELALGQYAGVGPVQLFERMAPLLTGLGYCQCGITFLIAIEYNLILAWVLYYLFAGFSTELPWEKCGENRLLCREIRGSNATENFCDECVWPSEDFYHHTVLGKGEPTDSDFSWCSYGEIRWPLVFCLLLAWTLIGSSLIQGVKSSGKVVYFTATFPFVVLVILLFKSVTLNGAGNGLSYLLSPKVKELWKPKVWITAATQVFYSLSIGYGGLHTLASYNQFNNNCLYDAVIISLSDTCVSILAGVVIFSMIGFIGYKTGKDVPDVVADGPGLTFVSMPDAVSQMPYPHFWSFVFFSMFCALGLDTMFTYMETLLTAMLDQFKWLRPHRSVVVIISCFVGFLLGVSLCAPQGYALFNLLDAKSSTWNLMSIVFMEVISVSWVYGFNNFWECIEEMEMQVHEGVKYYWLISWVCVSPALLFAILLWHLYCLSAPENCNGEGEEKTDELPGITILGYLITFAPLVFLPYYAIKTIVKYKKAGESDLAALITPTSDWAPDTFKSRPRQYRTKDFMYGKAQFWPPPYKAIPPHWDPAEFESSRNDNQTEIIVMPRSRSHLNQTGNNSTQSIVGDSSPDAIKLFYKKKNMETSNQGNQRSSRTRTSSATNGSYKTSSKSSSSNMCSTSTSLSSTSSSEEYTSTTTNANSNIDDTRSSYPD